MYFEKKNSHKNKVNEFPLSLKVIFEKKDKSSCDILPPSDDKNSKNNSNNDTENTVEIGQIRLVDWDDSKGKRLGTFPGTVLRPENNNGIEGYILQFQDGTYFVPTDELLRFPIKNENSISDDLIEREQLSLLDENSESESIKILSNPSDSKIKIFESDMSTDSEEFSDLDMDKSNNNDLLVFDCNVKSNDSNELVPVLDDKFFEDFPSKEKKKINKEKEKDSKLKMRYSSKQKKHISKQRDEKRTLSSFVGSKMSHTPCGPNEFFGTKQDCWR